MQPYAFEALWSAHSVDTTYANQSKNPRHLKKAEVVKMNAYVTLPKSGKYSGGVLRLS